MNPFSGLMTPAMLRVSKQDYEQFEYEYIIAALADKRFGQAFCERFMREEYRPATPLYYFRDRKISETWIKNNYLEQ